METLEPDAHPGMSLAAFAATASAETGLLDAVIVTNEDVAADHNFQRSLAALELPSVLLATVSREGRFRLISQGRRGSKLLSEATLDLEKLLTRPARRPAPLLDPAVPVGLPAILAVRPFPLLLSYQPFDPAMAWKAPWGGFLSISKDRCLFHWQQAERGARLVSDRLPSGGLLWTWASALDNYSLAVVGTFQQRRLWVVRVNPAATDCECYALDLQEGRPVAVCGHAGRVFVIYADRVDAFESPRSSGIKSKPIPEGLHWQRDRFFSSSTQWYALGFDGFNPVFEPLLAKTARPQAGKVLAFVDVPGVEGPVRIMDDGCLFLPNQALEKIVLHGLSIPVRLESISRSGSAMVISDSTGKQRRDVSLPDGRVERAFASPQHYHWRGHHDLWKFVRPQAVRNRFSKVFVDPQGRLGLVSRKSESVISLAANGQLVMESRRAEIPDKRFVASFNPSPAPQGVGYSLQVAKWKDGSLAWLDSRGMLHLKSSDRSASESDSRASRWPPGGLDLRGRHLRYGLFYR